MSKDSKIPLNGKRKSFLQKNIIVSIIISIEAVLSIGVGLIIFLNLDINNIIIDLLVNILAGLITLIFSTVVIDILLSKKKKKNEAKRILSHFRILKKYIDEYKEVIETTILLDEQKQILNYISFKKLYDYNDKVKHLTSSSSNYNVDVMCFTEREFLKEIKNMISTTTQ